jgi:hypothetical protein
MSNTENRPEEMLIALGAMVNCAWWVRAAMTRLDDPEGAREDLTQALECLPPEVRDLVA